jgi:AraC-like DNA-binding protein
VVDVPPLLRELILYAVGLGSLDRRVPQQARLVAVLVDQIRTLPSRSRALHLPQPSDPRARRLVAQLDADPAERRTLAALARRTGASIRTLQRVFRAETGMSVEVWRRQRRLGHALERLAAGATVTGAALDAGYQSVSAFVSVFRRTFGQTPGRYFRRVGDDGSPPRAPQVTSGS